jgi:hypothetical protein
MVFQQQKEAKKLLDGVVSAMMEVRKKNKKMTGWKEMKNVERWCFSIEKTDERLLVIGVSATGGK